MIPVLLLGCMIISAFLQEVVGSVSSHSDFGITKNFPVSENEEMRQTELEWMAETGKLSMTGEDREATDVLQLKYEVLEPVTTLPALKNTWHNFLDKLNVKFRSFFGDGGVSSYGDISSRTAAHVSTRPYSIEDIPFYVTPRLPLQFETAELFSSRINHEVCSWLRHRKNVLKGSASVPSVDNSLDALKEALTAESSDFYIGVLDSDITMLKDAGENRHADVLEIVRGMAHSAANVRRGALDEILGAIEDARRQFSEASIDRIVKLILKRWWDLGEYVGRVDSMRKGFVDMPINDTSQLRIHGCGSLMMRFGWWVSYLNMIKESKAVCSLYEVYSERVRSHRPEKVLDDIKRIDLMASVLKDCFLNW